MIITRFRESRYLVREGEVFIKVSVSILTVILYAKCELTFSNDFRDNQGVLKLMVGVRGPLFTIHHVT